MTGTDHGTTITTGSKSKIRIKYDNFILPVIFYRWGAGRKHIYVFISNLPSLSQDISQ